jgi:hypothetical protein
MNLKSNLQIVVFILAVLVSCSEPKNEAADTKEGSKSFKALPVSTEFDVVILNGRVMDPETNFDAIRNVGIKDGRNCFDYRRKIFQVRRPSMLPTMWLPQDLWTRIGTGQDLWAINWPYGMA